jgi:hypothetical protein
MVNSRLRNDMITGTVNGKHGTPTLALAWMAPDRTGQPANQMPDQDDHDPHVAHSRSPAMRRSGMRSMGCCCFVFAT